MTPEELLVGRRNLIAELRGVLRKTNGPVASIDWSTVRDLIEVLDQPADSLRDAVEKLAAAWVQRPVKESYSYPEANAYVDGKNDARESLSDQIRDLLTAHPAEPVGVSDEAVEAARRAREDAIRSIDRASDGSDWPDPMRAALEAAAPLMSATPRPDREALAEVLHDTFPSHSHKWARCPSVHRNPFYWQADAVLALMGGADG